MNGGAIVMTNAVLDFTQPGQFFSYTLTSDTTWIFTNHVAGQQVWLKVAQDSTGGWNNTWPTGLLWPGSTSVNGPTTPNTFSVFKILDDGSNWLAQAEGLNYTVPCVSNCNFALQFDGSQNYVTVAGGDVALNPSDLTVELWVKIPSNISGTLVATRDGNYDGWHVYINNGVPAFLITGLADNPPGWTRDERGQ